MKKNIDEKGRIFGKVSVIDLIVITLALIAVLAIFERANQNAQYQEITSEDSFSYSILIEGIRERTVASFQPGDEIFGDPSGDLMGKIEEIEVREAKRTIPTLDGRFVEGPVQDRYDVLLHIKADGRISQGSYLVGRAEEVSLNSRKKFKTKYVTMTALITELSVDA